MRKTTSTEQRVNARGVFVRIGAAAAHRDEMDRLRELSERLEDEYGPVTEEEQQAALGRIAAIDEWFDERFGQRPSDEDGPA